MSNSAWRQKVGLTQEELAERWAGVTRTTIQNWESGASPIPAAVETACPIWERRLKQENPAAGPVTLVYSDAPMFIDPYKPRRRLAMMMQEPYPTNAAAIARVLELWGRDDFENPFIIEKSNESLWNVVELQRVASGDDGGAPTLINLLRKTAAYVKQTSSNYVRSGPRLPTPAEVKKRREAIEALADDLEKLAKRSPARIRHQDVEEVLAALRDLGKHVPDDKVSSLVQAFGRRIL